MGQFKDIWNRDRDGNSREQRSFVRFAIVATVLFVLFLMVKKDNVIRWIQAGITLSQQQRQIEAYQEDNARLDKQIQLMSNNRDSLETYAREHFGFAAPGDDVYMEE